jgi:hypothetical protein
MQDAFFCAFIFSKIKIGQITTFLIYREIPMVINSHKNALNHEIPLVVIDAEILQNKKNEKIMAGLFPRRYYKTALLVQALHCISCRG